MRLLALDHCTTSTCTEVPATLHDLLRFETGILAGLQSERACGLQAMGSVLLCNDPVDAHA